MQGGFQNVPMRGGGAYSAHGFGGGDARGSTGDGGMGTSEVSSAGLGQDGQAWGEPETNHERLQQQIMPMHQQGQQQRQQQYQQSHLARQFEQRERKKKSQRQKQRKRLQNDGSSALSASGKYDEYLSSEPSKGTSRAKKKRRRRKHHYSKQQAQQRRRHQQQQQQGQFLEHQRMLAADAAMPQPDTQPAFRHPSYANSPPQPPAHQQATDAVGYHQNQNPSVVRITISSKLAPGRKMRMVVQRSSSAFTDHVSIDAAGIQWESFLSGVRERLDLGPQRRIKVYDSSNAEIRSVEDIMRGDDLVVVPTSEREHEIALLQHPAPHPQHHKIVSSLINGPNGVGLTTFFNSRKQITDTPVGLKQVAIPTWEKESRMTPRERRHLERHAERKRNMIGVEANFARGGAKGLNTYFNGQEQEGDKGRGVKRHPFASRSRGASLNFSELGTEIGLKMHELHGLGASQRRHRARGIRRITTMSRSRWKDMDPNNLPAPPPSSKKASPRPSSSGAGAGHIAKRVRIPGMPFPNEPLPGENISELLSNASTLSITSDETARSRQNMKCPRKPVQPGSSRGKRHFHKGQSTSLTHRRLVARGSRVTNDGYFQGAGYGYDPMRTNVGSLLGSTK